MKNLKNRILITTTIIISIIFVLSICCLDSETNIPEYIGKISAIYLMLFLYANKERYMHK